MEWVGGQNESLVRNTFADDLAQLERTVAGSLPNELPAADLARPWLIRKYSKHMAHTRSIPPSIILMDPVHSVLADPTPWAEAYEQQKLIGNIALAAFVLSLLLAAVAAPPALIAVVEGVGVVSYFLNRRKRREVIDIKELNGYDVTEERAEFRRSYRLLDGAVAVSILAYIVLMILLVLAFMAFWESLFDW